MKVEIDVDLGPMADKWEPVAFRQPERGEDYISGLTGNVLVCNGDSVDQSRLIVRRKWPWPEWLTAEWIAMDQDGRWWCHECEPRLSEYAWYSTGKLCWLSSGMLAFTPPPCTDWTHSKRRNPRVGKTA